MKRLIYVGIIWMAVNVSSAQKVYADDNTKSEKKTVDAIMDAEKLQSLEVAILEEYLKNQSVKDLTIVSKVRVYNSNGELVYEGPKDSEEARLHVLQSELLTETTEWSIYLQD